MLGIQIKPPSPITMKNTSLQIEWEKSDVRKVYMKMKIQSQSKTKILMLPKLTKLQAALIMVECLDQWR